MATRRICHMLHRPTVPIHCLCRFSICSYSAYIVLRQVPSYTACIYLRTYNKHTYLHVYGSMQRLQKLPLKYLFGIDSVVNGTRLVLNTLYMSILPSYKLLTFSLVDLLSLFMLKQQEKPPVSFFLLRDLFEHLLLVGERI